MNEEKEIGINQLDYKFDDNYFNSNQIDVQQSVSNSAFVYCYRTEIRDDDMYVL